MGKVFITDEVNDNYTADVTSGGKLKAEVGASNFSKVSSAKHLISAQVVNSAGCYVKSVIFGDAPATAATFTLWDTYTCASNVSAFGTSGSNIIATIGHDLSGSAFANYPKRVSLDVYVTSGLCVANSCSAVDNGARLGCLDNVTIIYQA